MIIMQVYDTRKPLTTNFKNLYIGCAFFDDKREIYAIRIADCNDDEGCANAVCLETGNLYFYEDDDEVTLIKAKIEVYA